MPKRRTTTTARDLVAICVAAAGALALAIYFDAFENFERWAQNYERWEVDELVVVPVVFGVAFGIYFWRRQRELKQSEERFRSLVRNSSDVMAVLDATGDALYISPSSKRVLGYEPEEALEMRAFDSMHPDDVERVREYHRRVVESPGIAPPIELRMRHADGSWRYMETVANNLLSDPHIGGIVLNTRDVTERKKAEEVLREREASLVEAQQVAHLGSWDTGLLKDGVPWIKQEMHWSDETYRILGYAPQSFIPTFESLVESIHPDDREQVGKAVRDSMHKGETYLDIEHPVLWRDGEVRFVQARIETFFDEDGEAIRKLGTLLDITERKRVEEELRNSEARNRTILEAIPDMIFRFGRDGEYLDFQAKDDAELHLPREEIVGKNVREVMPPELVEPILRAIAETLDTGEMRLLEYRLPMGDGARDYEARLLTSGPEEVLAIVRDVTERKALQRRLEYQAFHDDLTGLPNRVLFMDLLERALARTDRREGNVAVLFADIDDFKNVNDSLGHWAGDELLAEFARRLKASVRPGDTVARFGGDEFTILLEGVAEERVAIEVAERAIEELCREPFVLGGREVFVAPSVGIAVSGYTELGTADLLRRGDLALHRAKEEGKARYQCFTPDLDDRLRAWLKLESELREALERREFRVFYEPKISIGSGEIVGMEALVRWEHPERGLVLPAQFVPIAEETGLIVPVGRWVLGEACRQAKQWQVRYPKNPPLLMSVNLSARQFHQPDLVGEVAAVLKESGLDPRTLTLEITESAAMDDAESAIATMEELKGLGLRIEMDDFGTGHSSLSYLKRFPIDYLKIDRSFVGGLGNDPKDEVVLEAAIKLARTFGPTVVAEGMESGEQLGRLRRMGCELAQGYYFWGPLPAEAAGELLAAYNTY